MSEYSEENDRTAEEWRLSRLLNTSTNVDRLLNTPTSDVHQRVDDGENKRRLNYADFDGMR